MSVSQSTASVADSARERSRSETRRRLVEAGTTLFAAEGLHGVSSARIASSAGVATGTFYLHFADKTALFREIVFDALSRLRARQERARAAAGIEDAAELRASLTELVDFAQENRNLYRVLFGRDHEAAALSQDVLDDIIPGIEARFRKRASAGETSPAIHPAVAAQAMAAMVSRVLAWWLEDPERAPRAALIETLIQLHPLKTRS